MTTFPEPAGFLTDPPVDDQVGKMYSSDLEHQGYVANLTRVWAHSPDTLGVLSYALRLATDLCGLDVTERNLVVTATASGLGDAYCSFAFGSKLAGSIGAEITADIVRGDDGRLTQRGQLLASWGRQVARDPNGHDRGSGRGAPDGRLRRPADLRADFLRSPARSLLDRQRRARGDPRCRAPRPLARRSSATP